VPRRNTSPCGSGRIDAEQYGKKVYESATAGLPALSLASREVLAERDAERFLFRST
jgi:hypothetical protein